LKKKKVKQPKTQFVVVECPQILSDDPLILHKLLKDEDEWRDIEKETPAHLQRVRVWIDCEREKDAVWVWWKHRAKGEFFDVEEMEPVLFVRKWKPLEKRDGKSQ
jgi:hypothetical protein